MSPVKTALPEPSTITTLWGTDASWLLNWRSKAVLAGAVRLGSMKAMLRASSLTTVAPGAGVAAGPPLAAGLLPAVSAELQQSGTGVAPAAGVKFGSRQPVPVSTLPDASRIGSFVLLSRIVEVRGLGGRMKGLSVWVST